MPEKNLAYQLCKCISIEKYLSSNFVTLCVGGKLLIHKRILLALVLGRAQKRSIVIPIRVTKRTRQTLRNIFHILFRCQNVYVGFYCILLKLNCHLKVEDKYFRPFLYGNQGLRKGYSSKTVKVNLCFIYNYLNNWKLQSSAFFRVYVWTNEILCFH